MKVKVRFKKSDKLPKDKTCGDCVYHSRCKALIYTLNPENTVCDFEPSRFVAICINMK